MSENPFDGVTKVFHITDLAVVNELLSIKSKFPIPRTFRIIAVAKHVHEDGNEELVYSVGQFGDILCPRHEPKTLDQALGFLSDRDQTPDLAVKIETSQHGRQIVCFECPECGLIPIEEIKSNELS